MLFRGMTGEKITTGSSDCALLSCPSTSSYLGSFALSQSMHIEYSAAPERLKPRQATPVAGSDKVSE